MTDINKELIDFASLVVEAVKPLQEDLTRAEQQSEMYCNSLMELQKSKGCLFATVYYVERNSPLPDPIVNIKDVEVDTIQYNYLKYNEEKGKDNIILRKTIESFNNDTLINRLKKAFKGI